MKSAPPSTQTVASQLRQSSTTTGHGWFGLVGGVLIVTRSTTSCMALFAVTLTVKRLTHGPDCPKAKPTFVPTEPKGSPTTYGDVGFGVDTAAHEGGSPVTLSSAPTTLK